MENLLNPVMMDALFTAALTTAVMSLTGLSMWMLPWTDQDIRTVDKAINPMDLTEESLPLRRLVISRSHTG